MILDLDFGFLFTKKAEIHHFTSADSLIGTDSISCTSYWYTTYYSTTMKDGKANQTINQISAARMEQSSSSSLSRGGGKGKRDPSQSLLNKRDVATLLQRIRSDDSVTQVLKIKDHVLSDITPPILDSIFEALEENTVCVST